jgi:hypothetical protein
MMTELYYPTRIALENEDHSAPDLGGRHCHTGIPELGVKKLTIDLSSDPQSGRSERSVNVNSLET